MKTTAILVCFIFQFSTNFFGQGFVQIYPTEPSAKLSNKYKVFVNEIPISVYNNVSNVNDVSYVHFAFAGKVTIRIQNNVNIISYNLCPHTNGLAVTKSGKDISFDLDNPRKLLLKDVNGGAEQLCIFADPLEENPPKLGDANVVNIMDMGVDNTGATNNIVIIQDAINTLSSGSILFFPQGRYTVGGDLKLKSNVSIYLAGGAAIQASDNEQIRISFNGVNNFKLFGRGSIDARGDVFKPLYGGGNGGKELLILEKGSTSDNCAIEDIIFKSPITIGALIIGSTNWKVYNTKMIAGRQYGRKCWNPDEAVNMMMDNNFFYGNNDIIGLSTYRNNLNLNTTIRNNYLHIGISGASIRLGPWLGENTSNIRFENNDMIGGNNEYAIAMYLGGALSNVRYKHNRVEAAPHGMVFMRSNWTDFYAGSQSGSADDIIIDRLSFESGGVGYEGHLSCLEGPNSTNSIKNITFKHLYQKGVRQTSKNTADMLFSGGFVTNVQFTTSTTPIVGISAANLITYRAGSYPGKFTVKRDSCSTDNDLIVKYYVHGTAVNGVDYTEIADSVVIPAGLATAEISITPNPTSALEYYRTVFLSLSSSENYVLGPKFHAIVNIANGNIEDIDKQAPTIPINLQASSISKSGFKLLWNASSDNYKVATYQIFKNGVFLATTTDTSYIVSKLMASKEYQFSVKAWDVNGNASDISDTLKVTTLATDIITKQQAARLNTYPNPVVNHTFIIDTELSGCEKPTIIKIFNTCGVVCYQTKMVITDDNTVVLPESLSNGLYIITLISEIGNLQGKIIIE